MRGWIFVIRCMVVCGIRFMARFPESDAYSCMHVFLIRLRPLIWLVSEEAALQLSVLLAVETRVSLLVVDWLLKCLVVTGYCFLLGIRLQ